MKLSNIKIKDSRVTDIAQSLSELFHNLGSAQMSPKEKATFKDFLEYVESESNSDTMDTVLVESDVDFLSDYDRDDLDLTTPPVMKWLYQQDAQYLVDMFLTCMSPANLQECIDLAKVNSEF